jgi:RNA polymerase sigma-70 factor (ECF subfamily)
MWAFAVRLCRAQSDAEDLFQEAWSKMHRARATYARGTSPLCWCFAVLRSTHIDSLRRKKRRIETQDGAEIDDVSAGDAHSPEAAANARQTLDRFERALSALPAIHREAWVLTHEQGLSIADAAAVLGTTGTAVKLRVHRAASALREALGVTANG